MIDFKITKKLKKLEINNDKCHNYYYLIYGRIYNENKTRCRKFKFVEWFDVFDVQEYFNYKDFITKKDIEEYRDILEIPYISSIKNYNDEKGLKEFYNYCKETIENYNNIVRQF